MANLKQLGLMHTMYVNDYGLSDDRFKPGLWPGVFGVYYGSNVQIQICPATREDPGKRRSADSLKSGYGAADLPYRFPYTIGKGVSVEWVTGSYGFNAWIDRATHLDSAETRRLAFKTEAGVQRPSETPLFADSTDPERFTMPFHEPGRDLYAVFVDAGGSAMAHLTIARHGGSGTAHSSKPVPVGQPLGPYVNNIAFFDGHVSPIKLERLWNLYWHSQWVPPATRPP